MARRLEASASEEVQKLREQQHAAAAEAGESREWQEHRIGQLDAALQAAQAAAKQERAMRREAQTAADEALRYVSRQCLGAVL